MGTPPPGDAGIGTAQFCVVSFTEDGTKPEIITKQVMRKLSRPRRDKIVWNWREIRKDRIQVVFLILTQCNDVGYQLLRGSRCFHLHGANSTRKYKFTICTLPNCC